MSGVHVIFRVSRNVSIIRPWSCFTGFLILIGLPVFWLGLLGLYLGARNTGFGRWLGQLGGIIAIYILVFVAFVFCFSIFLGVQGVRDQQRTARERALADEADARRYRAKRGWD